jgi:hypothetical protein
MKPYRCVFHLSKVRLKILLQLFTTQFYKLMNNLQLRRGDFLLFKDGVMGGRPQITCSCMYSASSKIMCDSCVLLSEKWFPMVKKCKHPKHKENFQEFAILKQFIYPKQTFTSNDEICWSCLEKIRKREKTFDICLFCNSRLCNCACGHVRYASEIVQIGFEGHTESEWKPISKGGGKAEIMEKSETMIFITFEGPSYLEKFIVDKKKLDPRISIQIGNTILHHEKIFSKNDSPEEQLKQNLRDFKEACSNIF